MCVNYLNDQTCKNTIWGSYRVMKSSSYNLWSVHTFWSSFKIKTSRYVHNDQIHLPTLHLKNLIREIKYDCDAKWNWNIPFALVNNIIYVDEGDILGDTQKYVTNSTEKIILKCNELFSQYVYVSRENCDIAHWYHYTTLVWKDNFKTKISVSQKKSSAL